MSEMRLLVEIGPKGKKVAAFAPDWPGLSRGAKMEADAVERLWSYLPRYAPVAKLAGFDEAFAGITEIGDVERFPGVGSTDFWGISFAHSDFDRQPMTLDDLERDLSLLRACWTFFDDVAARVSPDLRLGPRGGGRNREQVVRHTIGAEQEWRNQLGLARPPAPVVDPVGLAAHRDSYIEALREHHAAGKTARKSPLRYLIRHSAYHTLDHAWEMEDRDLTE